MLPAEARLRRPEEFRAVLRSRSAVRTGGPALALHLVTTDARVTSSPRVGLVVSKAVGNSVVRNRTKRRLRAQLAARLDHLRSVAPGAELVVCAHPAAASLTSAEMGAELDRMIGTATRRLGGRRG